MTREEITTAIETLSYMKLNNPQLKSLDVAIEALNRQLKGMDMLDNIRAEIRHFMFEINPSSSESDYACNYMLEIIDKYRESEDT